MTSPPHDQDTATMAPPNPAPSAGRESRQERDKLEAIRDLLIGDQFQELELRFRNLEKSHEAHYSKISSELMTKFESLKVLNKSEVDDLGKSVAEIVSQLQQENSAIAEGIKTGTSRISELEKRVDAMQDALSGQFHRMQDEVSKQLSDFSHLIQSQQDAARQSVSRKDFAQLLSGLAGSLDARESPESPGEQ